MPAERLRMLTPGRPSCPPHHAGTPQQQPRAAAPSTHAARTTPATAGAPLVEGRTANSSPAATAMRTGLRNIMSSPDRPSKGALFGTMHASSGMGSSTVGGTSFRHTAGMAADSTRSRDALASCRMPREPATHVLTRPCSGKPCAAQAPATEATRRMLAADSGCGLSSAAGCRTACKQWHRRSQKHTRGAVRAITHYRATIAATWSMLNAA